MENAALHSETLQILHMARKCMHRSTTANSSDTLGKGYRKGFFYETVGLLSGLLFAENCCSVQPQ